MSGEVKTKLLAVDDYIAFDIETTGLDASWCEIIEIAAVKVRAGTVVDEFSSLVKPKDFPIPQFIVDLTGISNEMLIEAPSIEEVISRFESFIDDFTLIGHNVCFDAKFVSVALGRQLNNDLVDTMRISRHVNKQIATHKLRNVYQLCISEGAEKISGQSHRAGFDARASQIVYEHLKTKLIGLYGKDPESGWKRARVSRKHSSKTKKGEVFQTVEEVDDSNPFYGMHVCFTGKMNAMARSEAWQRLVNLGGIIEENVVKMLDYLVVGNDGFLSGVKGDKSKKIKDAEKNQLDGFPVQIISEDFFMEFAKDV